MTSQPPRALSRWRGWVPAFVCGTGLILIALITLWLRQTSTHVYTQGANALVIRAVLRTDVDVVAAETLAERLRSQVPGLAIEVVNEAMGRSILALQEPWIAEMPDFEVTPLPTLLEIHHPQLLTNPTSVAEFVQDLRDEAEVDFVAYNETAHDRLTKLAAATSALQSHTVRWMIASLVLIGLGTQVVFAAITTARTVIGIFLRQTAIWLSAWVAAALLFRAWESSAVATGDWTRLGSGSYFAVGVSALLVMLLGEALYAVIAWIRR